MKTNSIPIYKGTKKSNILAYLILCGLLVWGRTLHATTAQPSATNNTAKKPTIGHNNKASTAEVAPKATTSASSSADHMATDTPIQPLRKLLKDTPHQIAWQGWVDMAAYGNTRQATYAMVTLDGVLYTLQDRPILHTQSPIAITRTINLADYGFVLNIDVDKPDSFVLAKVNPANTTLTTYNAFDLDKPTTDTLADELISYIVQSDVQVTQVNRFLAWLAAEEMDEDALIEDIAAIPSESNSYNHFPALYQLIRTFTPLYKLISTYLQKDPEDKLPPDLGKGIPQTSTLLYALRTIPHHYVYIDANKNAIYSLSSDTTFVEDKEKAQQEKATPNTTTPTTTATDTPQRQRDFNPPHRRPIRSRSGWASHTASATPHGMRVDTLHYHLIPLVYQIAGDRHLLLPSAA